MNIKIATLTTLGIFAVAAVLGIIFTDKHKTTNSNSDVIDTFEECVANVGSYSGIEVGNRVCRYGDYLIYENTNEMTYDPQPDYNTNTNSSYSIYDTPGIENQLCPSDILGERKNQYEPYGGFYYLNKCYYSSYQKQLESPYRTEQKDCAADIEEEIDKRQYNLLNGCLYKNRELVFPKTIHNMIIDNEFGENIKIGEMADEWFRYEKNDYLYIFLMGGAGCGGCVYGGPFLKINNKNSAIEKSHYENIPYPPNIKLSNDNTRAIVFDIFPPNDQPEADFYLYDFTTGENVKTVYHVDDRRGYQICGDGCYLYDQVITWLDNDSISIQKYQTKEEDGYITLRYELIDDNTIKYFPDGDPVIVNL